MLSVDSFSFHYLIFISVHLFAVTEICLPIYKKKKGYVPFSEICRALQAIILGKIELTFPGQRRKRNLHVFVANSVGGVLSKQACEAEGRGKGMES